MWDLSGPGLEPMSPALTGRFLTTAPPGKSRCLVFSYGYTLVTITTIKTYSGPCLSSQDTFQDPRWMPEAADSMKPYVLLCFFLYVHACDEV